MREYLLASADWMPRNLDHRVEIAFPVLDPGLTFHIREILDTQLADTVKGAPRRAACLFDEQAVLDATRKAVETSGDTRAAPGQRSGPRSNRWSAHRGLGFEGEDPS